MVSLNENHNATSYVEGVKTWAAKTKDKAETMINVESKINFLFTMSLL
jgi:hypothetical protein